MNGQGLRGVPRRFRFPWRSAADLRRDVDDELEFHIALEAEKLERRGLAAAEARREAIRRFGDLEAARRALFAADKAAERAASMRSALAALWRDARYALRALRRSLGFSIAATSVLGLGIGSSIVVFSMLDTVVLRPLPLDDPERLFAIGAQPPPDAQWSRQWVNLTVLDEWRSSARSFERVAGFVDRQVTWRGPNGPERIAGAAVVGDLFPLLGATMALGRPFTSDDDEGAPVMLSHAFWLQRFGARADVVGETIEIDGVARTIVGVLPPETDIPVLGAQRLVWMPLSLAGVPRESVFAHVVGRLPRGVDRAAAAAELAAIQSNVEEERGLLSSARAAGVVLESMHENRSGLVGSTLAALFGGSVVLLLIASANVATLSLARLVERRHEMAVRTSLGASRLGLARQVVTEHVVLWSIGGAAGLAVGALGLRWVLRSDPLPAAQVPASEGIAIDARVALFAFAVTLATALIFGVLAARQGAQSSPSASLRADGATFSSSPLTERTRNVLAVVQVALSTVLASGACLLAVSFFNLTSQPLGFRADDLLTFRVQLPGRDYPDQQSRTGFHRALVAALDALPGLDAAGTTSALPLGTIPVGPITIPASEPRRDPPWAGLQAVDPNYFRAAGISIVAGREFDERDRAGGDPVVIVNGTFARAYFGGRDPIGRHVGLVPESDLRIVGVVADVKHAGLDWDYLPEVFVPYEQLRDGPLGDAAGTDVFAVLRVTDALAPSEAALRQLVSDLDPDLPLMELRTGAELVAIAAKGARFRAKVMGAASTLAVLLSALGLFAVLRQRVAQRRREYGIRMALGAAPRALLVGVCRSGVRLAAVGVLGGLAATLLAGRYVESLLFGIDAAEPVVLLGVAALMLIVAAAAVAIPAFGAARLSPTLSIRNE